MAQLRTAVIGPGKVGHNHARALQALPESAFTAVCGRDPRKTAEFAAQYGVTAYDDAAEMVAREGIDVVVVCTPHPAHAAHAVAALRAGAHVLVEKPLAANLADCDAMIAAAADSDRQVGVVSQRRFYEPVRRVKDAIDAGKIGRPLLATVQLLGWRGPEYYRSDPWRGSWELEGGGVLVNQSPHLLDLLIWFMGPVDELFAYWDNLNHPMIEVEDTAVVSLRFKNGGLGSIVASNSQNPGLYGNVHVHGENGASVGVQPEGGTMFVAGVSEMGEAPINDLWTVPGEEALLPAWQAADRATFAAMDAVQHYFDLQVQDFLQAVLEDRPPLVTAQDGRATVALFSAVYRSQQSGRPVNIDTQEIVS